VRFELVSDAERLQATFRSALAAADSVYIAVAWATPCEPLTALCEFAKASFAS
jgi:hypothetical protein